jgi:hypothetical protein
MFIQVIVNSVSAPPNSQRADFPQISPNQNFTPSSIPNSPHTPGSSRPLLSPDFVRPISGLNKYDGNGWGPPREETEGGQETSKPGHVFEDRLGLTSRQMGGSGRTVGSGMDIISMSLSYPLVEVLTRRPLAEFLDSCPPTRDLYIERTN